MELFDDNLIKEYTEWKDANLDNFSWWNFVNMKANLDLALAFAKFFSPEIVIVDGYFLLKDKFSKELFESWKKACSYNKTSVEKMMNLYQLRDFFHINNEYTENEDQKIKTLGKVLQFFWEMCLKNRYPSKQIKVEILEEDDGELFITVYVLQ